MTVGIRWGAVVLAGLCWVFLTRLGCDLLSASALHPQLMAPPVVVAVLLLPEIPGAITLALTALLHDAALGLPFGLSASLALPIHFLLLRIRNHLTTDSRRTAAALSLAVAPALQLGMIAALTLSGKPAPTDLRGLLVELAAGAAISALGAPWLAGLTLALLRLCGVRLDRREVVS